MNVCGRDIQVQGQLFRIARLDGDKYKFLDDPEPMLAGLRKSDTRVDLFTFMQKLPETTPKFSYPMEWDNLAVLPVSTFEDWWTKQIGFKARNKAKQAAKKGVVVREAPFDETFARGVLGNLQRKPSAPGKVVSALRKEPRNYKQNELDIPRYEHLHRRIPRGQADRFHQTDGG